jgi:hypothetical protein
MPLVDAGGHLGPESAGSACFVRDQHPAGTFRGQPGYRIVV